MRRSLLTAVGIMALTLAVPTAALAHHGRGHHHHKAHHAKFRFVHIGAGTASTTAPTGTAPTTPTTPPAPENAGTVASYTNGVLTLTLNDGSKVSGKVTADTRIGCIKPPPPPPATGTVQPMDQSPGDDNGQGDDQSRGDMSQQGDNEPGEWGHGDHGNGDNGDDNGEEVQGAPEPPCDSSALVTGAIVRAAELRIGPGGTEFENVLLVR
jgi:hypothetical protein